VLVAAGFNRVKSGMIPPALDRRMRTLTYLAVIVLIVGCASVGTPIAKQNIPRIEKGVTTEAELVKMFGAASDKSFDSNGKIIITWMHSAAQPKAASFIPYAGPFIGGTNVQVEKLVVVMGKDGRVEDYTYNESHPNVNMGGD
jgi:hypothetical protein